MSVSDDQVVESTLRFARTQLFVALSADNVLATTCPQGVLAARYREAVRNGEHVYGERRKHLARVREAYGYLVEKYLPFIKKWVRSRYGPLLSSPSFAVHLDREQLEQEACLGFVDACLTFDALIATPTQSRLLTRARYVMYATLRPIVQNAIKRAKAVASVPAASLRMSAVQDGKDGEESNETSPVEMVEDSSVMANPESVLLVQDRVESFRKYAERSTGKRRAVLMTIADGATAREAQDINGVSQQFVSQCWLAASAELD